jgi:hypothetical protein
MVARDRAPARARIRRALLCPVPVVAGLLGLASACLNPHPDEQPTLEEPSDEGVYPPLTCADNPLLSICPRPTTDPGAPAQAPGAGGSADEAGGSAGGAGNAGSAGDAGTTPDDRAVANPEFDAGERDAGPIDASPGADDAG